MPIYSYLRCKEYLTKHFHVIRSLSLPRWTRGPFLFGLNGLCDKCILLIGGVVCYTLCYFSTLGMPIIKAFEIRQFLGAGPPHIKCN